MTALVTTELQGKSIIDRPIINTVDKKVISIISPEEELLRFCEAYVKDNTVMDLLAFWGRYTDTRFTARAITGAFAGKKQRIAGALMDLVTAGLVKESDYNGTTLYSLTSDLRKRMLTIILGAIGWDRRKAILKLLEYKHHQEPIRI